MSESSTSTQTPTSVPIPVTDYGISDFIKVCKDIHDAKYGNSKQTLWMTRVCNFQTACLKANNPQAAGKFFMNFYSFYDNLITQDIFIKDGDNTIFNDKWLKDTTNYESKPSISGDDYSPKNTSCKGLVLYVNKEVKSHSIPISEVYLAAVSLAKEHGTSNVKMFAYPIKFLLHFYYILCNIVPDLDNGKNQIIKNTTTLKSELDDLCPPESNNSSSGGMGDMISNLMKSMGGGNIDTKNIEKMMGDVFKGEAMQNMSNAINKIVENVSKPSTNGSVGSESIMDKLSDSLKDQEVRDTLNIAIKSASDQVSSLMSSASGTSNNDSASSVQNNFTPKNDS